MENKIKTIIFYHDDMDGIASASVVLNKYKHKQNVECIKVNYNQEIDLEIVKNNIVYVLDFSFNETQMNYIKDNSNDLIWIDHHKTAQEKLSNMWNDINIKGIRDISKAACELTWNYIYPDKKTLPDAIKYIADRDTWTFKFGNDTKAFHERITMIYKKPGIDLCYATKGIFNEHIKHGYLLLDKKQDQIKSNFEKGFDFIFKKKYNGRLINAVNSTSELGEYCYKEKGYDLVLMFQIIENKIVFSLRSNHLDVSELAKKYGGGGHKLASGFSLDLIEGAELLDNIYKFGYLI